MEVTKLKSSIEVIRGILSVKQYGRIKDKTFENHLCILYHGIQTLSPRIDLYDTNSVEQNKTVDCKQTVYIETASWRKWDTIGPTLSFEVKNGSQRYTLIFKDNAMLREWLLSLCCISQGLFASKHVVGVNSEGIIHPSLTTKDEALAAISNTASNFFVLADQSGACYNLGLKGVFNMEIGQGIIKLSPITGNMTVKWSIEYLRTYGFSPQTVFIYAGSRSSTGEGRFVFRTMESKKINDSIDQQAAIIEDNKTGTNSSHSVFPTNGLLHAKDNVPEKVTAAALSKVSAPKDTETEYSNVETNTLSVTSQDSNFLKQLDNTLDSKRQLVARTLSNSSFESGHVTQDKQARKKLEKEQKRKEEDAKKQQKRQQELDKKQEKRRQEEEKKQRLREERDKKEEKRRQEEEKKVQKKLAKQKIQKKASHAESPPPEPEDLYANADDVAGAPKFSQASVDCEYAEAGDFTPKSYPVQLDTNTTQIYQDPWENKALPSPVNGQIQLIDDNDSIYAQPNKKTNIPKPLANDLCPPEYSSTYDGPPPPIIPPTYAVDDSSGGSDNIYAHTNDASNSATIDSGNVYGIGSASAQFVSKKEAVDNPANVYDNF